MPIQYAIGHREGQIDLLIVPKGHPHFWEVAAHGWRFDLSDANTVTKVYTRQGQNVRSCILHGGPANNRWTVLLTEGKPLTHTLRSTLTPAA